MTGLTGQRRPQDWTARGAEPVFEGTALRRAPASPGQRRFWLMEQLQPGNPALNIAARWRLQGTVAVQDLQQALHRITQRHEPLRTVFEAVDGEPVQVIRPPPMLPPQIPVIDLSRLAPADADIESERLARIEARRGFDLSVAPLMRASLLRVDAATSILLLTLHHIVGDGWSLGVIAHELAELCAAQHEQRTPQLPELPVGYAEFSEWQAECQVDPAAAAGPVFWREALRGMTPFRLPPDRPATTAPSAAGEVLSLSLPEGLGITLARVARAHACTMFAVASTALTAVLHRYTGETDIGIGTQVPGRDEVELEPLIGMFGNTLVLRHDLSGDPAFSDLLARTRARVLAAFEHQDTPLEKVIEVLRPTRAGGRSALFSISLMVNPALVRDPDCGAFRLVDLPPVSPGTMYDLAFHMVEHAGGWRISCEYSTESFACTTVARLLRHFSVALQAIAADPGQRLSSLSVPAMADQRARLAREEPAPQTYTAPPPPSPTGTVEARLAAIWCALLDVQTVERDANFFELGGHSLLAAKLLARIEAMFGRRISLATMFQAPTLGALAALLEEETGEGRHYDFRQVVRLQASTAGPDAGRPLIALNNTGIYYGLAKQLGAQQSFVSLQLFDPSIPDQLLPECFEDIASAYVRLIRRVQPQGPYALLGWCIAGTLAFEVARQLRRQGEQVAHLYLLDTWAPGYLQRLPRLRALLASYSHRWQLLAMDWARLRRGTLQWRQFLSQRPSLQRLFGLLRREPAAPEAEVDVSGRPVSAQHYDEWLLAYLQRTVDAYRPGDYDGALTLFRSVEQPGGRFLDEAMGWRMLTSGAVDVIDVDGDHFTMFQGQGLQRIAQRIAQVSAQASVLARHPS